MKQLRLGAEFEGKRHWASESETPWRNSDEMMVRERWRCLLFLNPGELPSFSKNFAVAARSWVSENRRAANSCSCTLANATYVPRAKTSKEASPKYDQWCSAESLSEPKAGGWRNLEDHWTPWHQFQGNGPAGRYQIQSISKFYWPQ